MTRLRIALPPAPNRTIGATSGLQPVEAPAEIVGDLLMSAMTGGEDHVVRSLAVRGQTRRSGPVPAQRGDMAGGARCGSGPRKINPHQAERQLEPKAARPVPGSAAGVHTGRWHRLSRRRPRSRRIPAISRKLRETTGYWRTSTPQ